MRIIVVALVLVLAVGCSDEEPTASTTTTSTTATTATTVVEATTTRPVVMMEPVVLDDAPATCAEATAGRDITMLLSAFVAARRAGSGAEDCLTPEALSHYCDVDGDPCTDHDLDFAPGPNCLYGCYGGTVSEVIADAAPDGPDRHRVYLQVRYTGEYRGANEGIVVAVVGGRFVLTEVTTSA